MFTKITSLSLLAGLAALSVSSAAFAGGGSAPPPGKPGPADDFLDCDFVAGADVNANCTVDITKATLGASVTATCYSPAEWDGDVLEVDVDELFIGCKADADVTGFLTSTLNAVVDCKAQLAKDLKQDLTGKIDQTIKALVDQGKLSVESVEPLKALLDGQIEVAAATQCDAHFGLAAVANLEARLEAFCGATADAHVQVLNLLQCDINACVGLEVEAEAACNATVDAGGHLQCNGALVLGVDIDLALDLDLDGDVDVGLDILSPDLAKFANGFINIDLNGDNLVDQKLPVAISGVAGLLGDLSVPKLNASVDTDGDGIIDIDIDLNGLLNIDIDLDVDVDIDINLVKALKGKDGGYLGVNALALDLNGDGKIDTAFGIKPITVAGSHDSPPGSSPDVGAPGSSPSTSSSSGGCSTAPGGLASDLNGSLFLGSIAALVGGLRRRNRKG